MTALIQLDAVGKDYPRISSRSGRLATLLSLLRGNAGTSIFTAIDNVTLNLRRGESLGLIGENGAGKSTLLKMIAGVVRPTRGRMSVNGSVGALLELGAGFHPDYTGRDNVYLAASLMGLSRREIDAQMESILDFADIGDHIDQPVKHYSSGMVVRLGFSVATRMKPDILITDEVLAVGDESFQKKCINWMENYLAEGGTLLLCSHSMFHIQKLCRHALWLDHGCVRRYGEAHEVAQAYLAYHELKTRKEYVAPTEASTAPRGDVYKLLKFSLNGISDESGITQNLGTDLEVTGTVYSPDGRTPNIAIGVVRADGSNVYGVVSDMDKFQLRAIGDQCFAFALRFPALDLLPGRYEVRGHAMDPEGLRLFDHVALPLEITGASRELGLYRLPHHWH